ncbi:uncharacterized protein LOC119095928 [Pollicipes pollicipes]|uniref:uncharacterized protein LOC119095928 n=1 Tax=Pollicipes pollicipes TaxID=41117 RepID=UPI00188533BF|nr:uncharacterized protein LOC119095928 [Pollicipes pollicipes]
MVLHRFVEDFVLDSSYSLLLHGREGPTPDATYQLLTNGIVIEGHIAISLICSFGLTVTVRENLRRAPCNDDPSYRHVRCMEQCMWRMVIRRAGLHCRAPWMSFNGPSDLEKNFDLPDPEMCTDGEQLQLLSDTEFEMLKADVKRECTGCPVSCITETFISKDTEHDKSWNEYTNSLLSLTYRMPPLIPRDTYRISYDGVAALAGIGGNLGLLLGFSVLTALEVVMALAGGCWAALSWLHSGCLRGVGGAGRKVDSASSSMDSVRSPYQ